MRIILIKEKNCNWIIRCLFCRYFFIVIKIIAISCIKFSIFFIKINCHSELIFRAIFFSVVYWCFLGSAEKLCLVELYFCGGKIQRFLFKILGNSVNYKTCNWNHRHSLKIKIIVDGSLKWNLILTDVSSDSDFNFFLLSFHY